MFARCKLGVLDSVGLVAGLGLGKLGNRVVAQIVTLLRYTGIDRLHSIEGGEVTRQNVKSVFLCFALMIAVIGLAPASPLQGPGSPVADPLVGKWNLNAEKSTNPPASEIVTITSQGSRFVLDFDRKQDNGYNPKYSLTTEMKGIAVAPVYANGSKTADQWRVTRQGPRKFEMELISQFGGWKDEYEVSDDGTTMTMHRHESQTGAIAGKVDSNGTFHCTEHIFVFDKAK